MAEEESHELMTVKETANYLRVPLPTVYYLVQRGQLPAVQIGGRWRVKRRLLDRDVLHNEEPRQPTVLVIDDDAAVQSLFRRYLKKAGFGRVVAGSVAAALAEARKQSFDLIFLGLELPDLPIEALYEQLKEIDPESPIVIISACPESTSLRNILTHGPVTLLPRPVEFEQINRTIKEHGHKGVEVETV